MNGRQTRVQRTPERLRVEISPEQAVTACVYNASERTHAGVTLILGHGAGADQTSDFMIKFASALSARGITVVTFNFLYTELGRRAPDRNNILEACFRSVIEIVRNRIGSDKLVVGGKSMGGRIASQIAAADDPNLAGLVFLGYPLHQPGKLDQLRAKHLSDIKIPMLFVQGSRDPFGTPDELRPTVQQLKVRTELYVVAGGDHSFKVLKRSGITQDDTDKAVLDHIEQWLRQNFVT